MWKYESQTHVMDAWQEGKRREAARHVAAFAGPGMDEMTLLEMVASAWAADCAHARNFMQDNGLKDAHMICIIGNEADVVEAFMRDEEEAYVRAVS